MTNNKLAVTVTLHLTRDAWLDLESALLDRQIAAQGHAAMEARLRLIRHEVEAQVLEQKPRWSVR